MFVQNLMLYGSIQWSNVFKQFFELLSNAKVSVS